MGIAATVSLKTPFGIIRKLANGSYRLRNSSKSLYHLFNQEYETFMFLVDEGFVIKSFKYTKRQKGGKETVINLDAHKNSKISCLPEALDFMEQENYKDLDSCTATLIVDLERYSRIKLGVVLAPSNENNEVISIKNVLKDSLAQRAGILKDDLIVSIDDKDINLIDHLEQKIITESSVCLTIKRQNTLKKIEISLR